MKQIVFCLLIAALCPSLPAGQERLQERVDVRGVVFTAEPDSKNVVVVDSQTIAALGVDSFSSLFAALPALDVARRGPGDSSFDLALRGSHFEQVLILVDGVPLANPQTGHFNTDLPFSLQDVERVEIVRGGNSTTYGAGAFAGVVNFVLKKGGDWHLRATGGEHRYGSLALSGGVRRGPFAVAASVDRVTTAGFYAGREYAESRGTLRLHYERDRVAAGIQAGLSDKRYGADGFYAPYPSWESGGAGYVSGRVALSRGPWSFTLTPSWQRHRDHFLLDRRRPEFYVGDHTTDRFYVAAAAVFSGSAWRIESGGEAALEKMNSRSMGRHDRFRRALYLNVRRDLLPSGRFALDGGVRFEGVDGDPLVCTWRVGLYRTISSCLQWRLGYGRSYRLPSFTELYYAAPGNYGDPTLRPETSGNYETSLTWQNSLAGVNGLADIALFFRDQRDTIDWVRHSPADAWRAVNVRKNDVAGMEITQQWQHRRLQVSVGLERLWAVRDRTTFQSKYGLRFPEWRLNVLWRQGLPAGGDFSVRYEYKSLYRTTERGAFWDVTLGIRWHGVRFFVRGENLGGTRLEEIPGVKTAGRWFYAGIEW